MMACDDKASKYCTAVDEYRCMQYTKYNLPVAREKSELRRKEILLWKSHLLFYLI
jgi:hypothetical protein